MLIPKACAFMGFALREHDITWRTGIIFPSVTTIPFCKIQQVSIRQNPVSRLFGLYSVHIVNGAQMMADTAIPEWPPPGAVQDTLPVRTWECWQTCITCGPLR